MPNRPIRPGKHAARHKSPTALSQVTRRLPSGSKLGLRRTGGTVVALGAVVLAGAAGNGATDIASGAASGDESSESTPAITLPSANDVSAAAGERSAGAVEASRSQAREPLTDPQAERRDHGGAPDDDRTGAHTAQAKSIVPKDPRDVARSMMQAEYGWGAGEFSCLDDLWVSESDWEVQAENPSSGAYGIPQSLPPEKMASAGSDWRTNAATQIEWGLWYIDQSYGTPCSAWEFKQANNWY